MRQSKSYMLFRESIQEIFSFAVMVTASVPALKQAINVYKKGVTGRLPDVDYFQPSVVYVITEKTLQELRNLGVDANNLGRLEKIKNITFTNNEFKTNVIRAIGEQLYKQHRNILKKQSPDYIKNTEDSTHGYQQKLATYLYFSAFSYFEAYIYDLAKEVASQFSKIERSAYESLHVISQSTLAHRTKLNKPYFGGHLDRYKKYSRVLDSSGYIAPEKLIFSSLLAMFDEKIEDLKANDLPVFLNKFFLFKMTEADSKQFHLLRDNRNSIGHGDKAFVPNLNDVIEANKFYKSISAKIDEHVVFHFFKLRNYQD